MAAARRDRETLRLASAPSTGAAAHGLVVSRARLVAEAERLETRRAAYAGLMLCFSGEEAVLWSAEKPELPWFGEGVLYLGAPTDRLFTPLGLRLATPPLLLKVCLVALEKQRGVAPPLLLRQATDGGGVSVLDLRPSVPLADVDWRRLSMRAA